MLRAVAPRRRLLALVALVALVTACGEDAGVLVRVEADGVANVDAIVVEARGAPPRELLARRRIRVGGLPTTVLLATGPATSGERIRVHVDAIAGGVIAGSGDAIVEVPPRDQIEATVRVAGRCAGVVCPAFQSCDPSGACDGACTVDDECTGVVGCAPTSACGGGTCALAAADADGDTERDARCPVAPGGTDCDDTASGARSGGTAFCGPARDHDCDGRLDELERCPTACGAPAITEIDVAGVEVEAPAELRALGGARIEREQLLAFAATADAIVSYELSASGSVGLTEIARVPAASVRQLFLVGPLLAAATADGLLLVAVDENGALQAAGAPLAVPPHDPRPVTAVLVDGGVAWVSGEGIGLGAIDVTRPASPRWLGGQEGPAAFTIAPLSNGIITASADPARQVVLYPIAEGERGPEPGQDLTAAFADAGVVTALATEAGTAADPSEILAVASAGTSAGVLRVFQRSAAARFDITAEATGLALIAEVRLLDGVLIFATSGGTVGAIQRSGAGMLGDVRTTWPAADARLGGLWATAGAMQPQAIVAAGSSLRVVALSCR